MRIKMEMIIAMYLFMINSTQSLFQSDILTDKPELFSVYSYSLHTMTTQLVLCLGFLIFYFFFPLHAFSKQHLCLISILTIHLLRIMLVRFIWNTVYNSRVSYFWNICKQLGYWKWDVFLWYIVFKNEKRKYSIYTNCSCPENWHWKCSYKHEMKMR